MEVNEVLHFTFCVDSGWCNHILWMEYLLLRGKLNVLFKM